MGSAAGDGHSSGGADKIRSRNAAHAEGARVIPQLGASEGAVAGGQGTEKVDVGPCCSRATATECRIVSDVGAGQGLAGQRAGLFQQTAAIDTIAGLRVAIEDEYFRGRNDV